MSEKRDLLISTGTGEFLEPVRLFLRIVHGFRSFRARFMTDFVHGSIRCLELPHALHACIIIDEPVYALSVIINLVWQKKLSVFNIISRDFIALILFRSLYLSVYCTFDLFFLMQTTNYIMMLMK